MAVAKAVAGPAGLCAVNIKRKRFAARKISGAMEYNEISPKSCSHRQCWRNRQKKSEKSIEVIAEMLLGNRPAIKHRESEGLGEAAW